MQKHNKMTLKREAFYSPFQPFIIFIHIVGEFTLTLYGNVCLKKPYTWVCQFTLARKVLSLPWTKSAGIHKICKLLKI